MYIDWETLINIGKVLGALSVIAGLFVAVYKFIERSKKQQDEIASIKREQTLICYGVLACLKGLKEQGCNGPVTKALDKLEKHLNEGAHGLNDLL
nr:MAG TPA: Phospholamban [Bacteriophage sp.]